LSDIVIRQQNDPRYLELVSQGGSKSNFNLTGGLGLFHARFYLGYTFGQYLGKSLLSDPMDVLVAYKGSNISIGYKFGLNENWKIFSSAHYKLLFSHKDSFLATIRAKYKGFLEFGSTYKNEESAGFFAGFQVKKLVELTYSYELPVSDNSSVGKGTHEVVLGFRITQVQRRSYFW
ncbi:MAG: type IX secretion system membrane protein PorP/SprF, partial [Cytophagales bacterium]|nr:type IX secretion system membrane protein PorP/SprF [Cytophagales bacterium]